MLVVDDEFAILEAVSELLRLEALSSAPRAMDASAGGAGGGAASVALIDVMMPSMTGIALAEAMQADPRYRQVPVVLMTAAIVAIPAGMAARVAVIRKPFLIEALLDTLRAAMAPAGSTGQR